jgi:hypothetical protein
MESESGRSCELSDASQLRVGGFQLGLKECEKQLIVLSCDHNAM